VTIRPISTTFRGLSIEGTADKDPGDWYQPPDVSWTLDPIEINDEEEFLDYCVAESKLEGRLLTTDDDCALPSDEGELAALLDAATELWSEAINEHISYEVGP